MLAGGRLAVRGGAEFAFELGNNREESVYRFLRCSNKGRWSYLEQGVVLARKPASLPLRGGGCFQMELGAGV